MPPPHDPLLAALRAAPRRYLLPPLPADAAAARAEGTETALAWAIEAARVASEHGRMPPAEAGPLFTSALADFIRAALAPAGGDPAFQALVLQAREPLVREYVRLAATEAADRRALRSLADAVAHPGKLRAREPGPVRDALARVHALAGDGDWAGLRDFHRALAGAAVDESVRTALEAIATSPALQRRLRSEGLRATRAVQDYLALCAQRGPLAGSDAATQSGRASARAGAEAERATLEAFACIAQLLDAQEGAAGTHRAIGRLRPPAGFPGTAKKAKDEWDAAIVRAAPGAAAQVLLLAEVKATPAAASPDYSRLLRGLQRLAHADPRHAYAFRCDAGEVQLAGASLRHLQPHGGALPAHVLYCCTAPPEAQPALLGAASKSVFGAEPASIAFALRLAHGEPAAHEELAPVWDALATAPRLRAVLHQDATTRRAREAMLHPADLLAALAAQSVK